jgi:hypothetical protein
LDEPQLPKRLRAVEPLGEDPPDELSELLVAPRAGERRVANVVVEIEARIVDLERTSHLEPREGELLPVARHEVEPRLQMGAELFTRRRWPVERHERADVHVGRALLLVQEGGVYG